jgi:hypothetical protein
MLPQMVGLGGHRRCIAVVPLNACSLVLGSILSCTIVVWCSVVLFVVLSALWCCCTISTTCLI